MCLAAGRLGFVNLVNREEIPNVITNQSVDFFPLGSYLSKWVDCWWNETKYIALISSGVNK